MDKETLIPVAGVVTKIRRDTGDVKTFLVEKEDGGKPFRPLAMQTKYVDIK